MKISLFGMGYVGVVSGTCLLQDGHEIVGIDPVGAKVTDLQRGLSPIQEPGVAELLAAGHDGGRLKATSNPEEGLSGSDMAWICVGTPSHFDGGIDLTAVETVTGQIGRAIRKSEDRPLIVIRSTCPPGTTQQRIIPLLENESGLTVGREIDLVFHPEFLREGTAVEDFFRPPKIVVGEARDGAADRLLELYETYDAPVFRVSITEAEMVKYYDNLFHALKITFANEIGAVAKSAGVDARKVADVFCADTKLNISPRYLRPGPAFGGSCLPKDLRAILRLASLQFVRLPMLEKVLESNEVQVDNVVRRILAHRPQTVGMIGLAFKAGTDDMRESPYVKIAKTLIGEGIRLRIYDPVVQPERLIGSNKEQVLEALRHLEELLVASLDDLASADLILVNHTTIDAKRVRSWIDAKIRILDLAGIEGVDPQTPGYDGLYW